MIAKGAITKRANDERLPAATIERDYVLGHERQQCRDLFDMHKLLDGNHVDALEAWDLYLRKAAHDVVRGRQRTSPREWSTTFDRRLESYKRLWDDELGEYLTVDVPHFGDVERRTRKLLAPVLVAARAHADAADA